MSKRRVVVTGLGAVTPIGNNVEDFWAGIREGKVGIGPITKFDTTDYKVKIAAEVKDFNAKDHMDPRAARRMDPFCQYAVTAAKEAFEDAGLDMEKEDSFRVGVIVGSGIGSLPQVENNYEKILTMYNDTMQGKAQYLGFILCGTPQCMEDPRRGVYSYEALRSRLAEGHFSGEHKDLLSPVIRLQPLTYEEMLILTEKLADIHAGLYDYPQIVTQQDMVDFIEIEFGRIGADTHITPREVIRDFIEVLDIVYQNPGISVRGLLGSDQFRYAQNAVKEEQTDDSLAEFEL